MPATDVFSAVSVSAAFDDRRPIQATNLPVTTITVAARYQRHRAPENLATRLNRLRRLIPDIAFFQHRVDGSLDLDPASGKRNEQKESDSHTRESLVTNREALRLDETRAPQQKGFYHNGYHKENRNHPSH